VTYGNFGGPGALPVVRIKSRKNNATVIILAIALGLSLIVNIVALWQIDTLRQTAAESAQSAEQPMVAQQKRLDLEATLDDGEVTEALSLPDLYETAIASVVAIQCGFSQGTGFAYAITHPEGQGSVIVTSYHVIEGCDFTDRSVTLRGQEGGEVWTATVFSDSGPS